MWTQRMVISWCRGFFFFSWGSFRFHWADFFGYFSKDFRIFARFWVLFFGPKNGPKNGLQIRAFNRIPIVGAKAGPIFGSISGTHFWAPEFDFFSRFF